MNISMILTILIIAIALLLLAQILVYQLRKRSEDREQEEQQQKLQSTTQENGVSTCSRCSASLRKTTGKFCPKCGVSVLENANQIDYANSPNYPNYKKQTDDNSTNAQTEEMKKRRKRRNVFCEISYGAVVAVGVAVVLVVNTIFTGDGSSDDSISDEVVVAENETSEEATEESSVADTTKATEKTTTKATTTEVTTTESNGIFTPDGTLGDDGDQLSILCWTDTDLNAMLEVTSAKNATYVNVGSDGTEASKQYITYFSSGEDVDLYFCDADWTMAYVNNDKYSAPLSALGIDKSDYSDAYSYTVAVGTSDAGVLKAASFQAAGGVYAYRTDLAEEYLGVTTPDEMQAYVSDWDTFWSTAATVHDALNGVTAMADTIAGVWRAYNCARNTTWVTDGIFTYDDTLITTIDTIYDAYTSGYICNGIEQWTNDWYAIGYATGSLANNTMGYFFPSWSLTSTGHLASAEGYNWETDSFDNVGTSGLYAVTKDSSGWYWGGTWICVSPLCDNATAAAQFMYDMTINAETMKEYAINHSDFVNNQTVMQEIIDEGSNCNTLLQEGYQDQFPALADSAASIDLDGVATEYDGTVTTDLVNAITSYCQGGVSSAEDCLEAFLDSVAADLPDVTVY